MRETDTGTLPALRIPYDMVTDEFLGQEYHALVRRDLADANGNRLLAIRGLARNVEDLEHRDHPRGVVYLDGACRGPYLDAKRRIYSLDHHERCYRQITLSTCVQALRFTRDRVIQAVGFKIIANDPDMDTILAAWALLHADRMAYDDGVFRKVRPLFAVAGNTDAYGFGHDDLLDLSAERITEIRGRILWLAQREMRIKAEGRWNFTDFLAHMEKVLKRVDEFALHPGGADEITSIEAQEEVGLPNGDTIIMAQASMGGVYGVERELVRRARNDRCAAIIFYDGRTKWTIKLTQMVSRYDLEPLWKVLTRLEREAKEKEHVTDQRLLEVGWGGSSGIGGEPRYYNGRGPFIGADVIRQAVVEELTRQQARFSRTPPPPVPVPA